MEFEGVGKFKQGEGCWESEPESINGSLLSIESDTITDDHIMRAREVCENWKQFLQNSLNFIELSRKRYSLSAKDFLNPSVFINDDEIWTIYFSSESELESTVGVEFKSNQPFQLIIAD